MQKAFVRSLLITFAVFAVVFIGEAAFEWIRLGRPGANAVSWAEVNNTKLVDIMSPVARAYNNVLAMLLATIGLAIPLTANMHTPKLISIFFEDWINRIVLFLMAFGAANVLWVAYMIGPHYAPMWSIRATLLFALFGWVLLIPYFFYVVRYLDPSEIVVRLRDRASRMMADAGRPGLDTEAFQDSIHDTLSQIGTIVLKSLDRSDRSVALEGIWAFKVLADKYGAVKNQLPERAFVVDRHDFVGLSAEAIEQLIETRTWYERMLLSQVQICFRAALSKASDTVSSMSDATRVILENAHRRGDMEARDMAMRALNGFVRSAIHAKNVHAIYDVFYQYRMLAKNLREDPEILRQIARALREYSGACRDGGIPFAAQLAAFDLGSITRRAYEVKSEASVELLDTLLSMPHRTASGPTPLVVKAKILIGAFLVERGLNAEATKVRENLADVAASVLQNATADLLAAKKTYFELTARQVDLEYVAPERRPHVTAFCTSCTDSARTSEVIENPRPAA